MPNASPVEPPCIHEIEPFLRGPVPRRLRCSLPMGALLVSMAGFWMACFALALTAFVGCAKLIWLEESGHPALARVFEVVFDDGRRTAVASAELTPRSLMHVAGVVYVFQTDDGTECQGTSAVASPAGNHGFSSTGYYGHETAARLTDLQRLVLSGRPWRIRYAPWFGKTISEIWTQPPLGKMIFLCVVGTFVFGCGSFITWRLIHWLGARARLLRQGSATFGTVTHLRTDAVDSVKFYVRYGYAAGGVTFEHEEQCNPSQWRSLQVGESVTVLHDPQMPRLAALYQLIPFRA